MSTISLGGPGPGCSVAWIRRLVSGELTGEARARVEEHLGSCSRCQATRLQVAEETRAVVAVLPFEALAAGVAERLAGAGRAATETRSPARARWLRVVPLGLAAAFALGLAVPLVARLTAAEKSPLQVKGAAALTLWLQAPGDVARLLEPGEPVPEGAALRLELPRSSHAHVAVVLLDADGPTAFYGGAAVSGPLPGAFEWTGRGSATVMAVLCERPIDPAGLVRRLARGGPIAEAASAEAGPGCEVVSRRLTRPGAGP